MFLHSKKRQFIFVFFFSSFLSLLTISIFYPILSATTVIFPYAIHPFDICIKFPTFWFYFKIIYMFFSIISHILFSLLLYHHLFTPKDKPSKKVSVPNPHNLQLLLGENPQKEKVFLPEKSLYQNILITGTIGCGKTSSAMYPFAEQLIAYEHNCEDKKIGMLILDVKGNFHKQVLSFAKKYNRLNDVILIGLNSKEHYNPLDKPTLKPAVLANRLKTILTLLSPNNTESFWLDKVEQILTEAIKFCRLYNNGYVTFSEIYHLIFEKNYYMSKLTLIKHLFQKDLLSESDLHCLLSCRNFFEQEFFQLDERTSSILKAELTRITAPFLSDYSIMQLFSSEKNTLTFSGFQDVLEKGKIVVLNMNLSEYTNLTKIISAYLKLDFQTEVMLRLNHSVDTARPVCFLCDEFHELVTSTDANFFAQSREAKCINIVATQSYSSLLNTLNNENTTKVIVQNLINKLWFRTDDIFTIEQIQKQIGKEDKEKISKSISENAQETKFNYFLNSFISKNSNLSESVSSYIQNDYVYDSKFFTQDLATFSCLSFLSDSKHILPPQQLNMFPYFLNLK